MVSSNSETFQQGNGGRRAPCVSPSAPLQAPPASLGETQEAGTQGLFCPKEIILGSDVTRCSLLGRADVGECGWEGEKEKHVLLRQSSATLWPLGSFEP